jgi:hypothetical protein
MRVVKFIENIIYLGRLRRKGEIMRVKESFDTKKVKVLKTLKEKHGKAK